MKIKDLPKHQSLGGVKVKTPQGVVGYWQSQWGYPDGKAGVWLAQTQKPGRIFPIFLDRLDEVLEWEVAGDEDKVNVNENSSLLNIKE